MKNFRLWFGTTFWCLVVALIVWLPILLPNNSWIGSFGRIARYVRAERQQVEVAFDRELYVQVGDPVYLKTEYGWKRIGQVVSEQVNEWGEPIWSESVTLALFGDAPPVTRDCYFTLHETPGTFEWALQRMFPPARRQEIIAELKAKFMDHQEEIVAGFVPVLQQTMDEVGQVLQEDLLRAIRENREQLATIGARYQETFVEKRLVPLVREVIWPIVEQRSRPLLNQVGNEIWQKASLWRFGWRLAYDQFPLTSSNLLQKEWERFVKQDALPVIESHSDEFYQLARSILREIAENPEVKLAGKEGLQQLLRDEEIKELTSRTLWQVLFENPRLNEVIRDSLSSEQTVQLLRDTSEKFEDKIREIGDRIFGTFDRGITREFAGVLRKEILRRDQRWLVLRYRDSEEDDRLEMTSRVDGFFVADASDRPEFVRYRNEE